MTASLFFSSEKMCFKKSWQDSIFPIFSKKIYRKDFDKQGGCGVVARERHETNVS